MDIQLGYYPQVFFLVLARTGAIVGGMTFLGGGRVPPRIRAALALALALLFTPLLSAGSAFSAVHLTGAFDIVMALLNEVLLGLVVALVCDIVFVICNLGGFIIGFSSSLSMAQVIDPASGISGELISAILQLICLMVFILNDAHLILIRLLYQSFAILPPVPSAWLNKDLLADVVLLLQKACVWGIRLAAPAIAVGMILDLSLGLIARMAPDFDILFLSLPIRLFLGFVTLGFILWHVGPIFNWSCEIVTKFCGRILVG